MNRTAAVIVNYNGAEDTLECVRSLFASSAVPTVVVVDNSPRDEALDRIVAEYPQVQLIRAPENLGFGRGNNLGISWAMKNTSCEYVFLLNNDAVCCAETIAILQSKLDDDEGIGIAAPKIVYYHAPDVLWYGGGEISWARGSARVPGFRKSAHSVSAMCERDVTFASGCAMLIRRCVVSDLGDFDPRLFMYEEDVEFCLRVIGAGWRIRYSPQALVKHKVQGGKSRSNEEYSSVWSPRNPLLPFYMFHISRNRLLNMRTHARGIDVVWFALFYPLRWSMRICEYLFYRRFDAVGAIIKGAVSGIRAH